jgi:release factor glutamine methyltransferase
MRPTPTGAIALMPPEARDHEPRVALDGGADGLDVQQRVAAAAPLARSGRQPADRDKRAAGSVDGRRDRCDRARAAGGTVRELDGTVVVGVRP